MKDIRVSHSQEITLLSRINLLSAKCLQESWISQRVVSVKYVTESMSKFNLFSLFQTAVISSCAATVQLLMHATVARTLGAVLYGRFQFILTTATVLSLLAPLGLQ